MDFDSFLNHSWDQNAAGKGFVSFFTHDQLKALRSTSRSCRELVNTVPILSENSGQLVCFDVFLTNIEQRMTDMHLKPKGIKRVSFKLSGDVVHQRTIKRWNMYRSYKLIFRTNPIPAARKSLFKL